MKREKFHQIKSCIEWAEQLPRNRDLLSFVAHKMQLSLSELNQLFIDWGDILPLPFFNALQPKQLAKTVNLKLVDLFSLQVNEPVDQLPPIIIHATDHCSISTPVSYSFFLTRFGEVCMARSQIGICSLSFISTKKAALADLTQRFTLIKEDRHPGTMKEMVLTFFEKGNQDQTSLSLDLSGTAFQLKVWKALMQIPMGKLSTYGEIASELHQPNASRAVGTAIGKNPIAFLVPCHRVIQKSGKLGGYRWGTDRKKSMLGWELVK